MKYAMKKPFASLMLVFALLALAVMAVQPAYAGDLKPAYKASNGVVFTIAADNLGFACYAGQVTVTQSNTNTRSFPDTSGAVCASVTNSAGFAETYVQQVGTPAGTKVYHRATWIESYCTTSGTLLSYNINGGPTVLNDGCQTDAVIKARAN